MTLMGWLGCKTSTQINKQTCSFLTHQTHCSSHQEPLACLFPSTDNSWKHKCPKISNTLLVIFQSKFCFLCICFLKYLMEWQTVYTLIRLLPQEQSDLGLHCLHMLFCQNFTVLGFNDMSTLVGHLRKKRDRRDEREGQERKRNRNESEETEEIKTFPLYP